ncbi:hypothetical protein EB077_08190 [bacterium]|nr:hypothetical protein [bacterium]
MDAFTTGGAKHGIEPALAYYSEHGTPFFALYIGKPTARHGNVMMQNWKGRIEEVEEVTTLQTLLMRIVDGVVPSQAPAPVRLSGVGDDAPQFDTEKLNRALVILKRADPNLEDDLLKLAAMAEENPKQFAFLLKML